MYGPLRPFTAPSGNQPFPPPWKRCRISNSELVSAFGSPCKLNAGDRPSFAGPDKFAMADKQTGKTDKPQAVEIDVTDEASLAAALQATMELEAPQDHEPKDTTTEVAEDDGTKEVLSQIEEEADAEAEPAAEESATEAEDEDAEGVDADDADDADDAPDDSNKGFQKRIDKLTKRAKGAEERESRKDERIAKLESDLAAKDAEPKEVIPAAPATPANPFTNATKLEDVQREEHNAEQILDWCDSNMDGALVQTSDGELEYSAEEVRDYRKAASKAIRKWLPERKQWIRENQAHDEYALKCYRWWEDKSATKYQAAMNLLREFPEIQRFPDYKVIVGDTLAGMHKRLAGEQKAKQSKAAKPKKAPKQPGAPTAEPVPVDDSTARSSSARKAFNESGDVDDLTNILAADYVN